MMIRWFPAILVPLLLALGIGSALGETPQVYVLHLKDTVQPVSESYIERGLDEAAAAHAAAVVLVIDTPGGLITSMRDIASRLLSSPVPVIAWVGPAGARAGSAGFFLLEAADIAAMAPGTNAGAAHPVAPGAKLDDTMKLKIENDAAAFLRSYTSRRNRNPQAAEDAVRQSKSYTEKEAKDLGLIDVVAINVPTLLQIVDGREIIRFDGSKAALHTRNARLVPIDPTTREQILGGLMNPDLAVLILVFGALLVYIEFNVPGTIIPGTLGTLMVLISLFALNLLPIHFASALLLIAGFVMVLLEVKFTSHGVLAAAGILCVIIGMLTLVNGPIPEMRVHPGVAIAIGLGFGLVTLFLVRIAVAARRNKIQIGKDEFIGRTAIATDRLDPDGQIMIQGELWQAHADIPIMQGETVRITSRKGLQLFVERLP